MEDITQSGVFKDKFIAPLDQTFDDLKYPFDERVNKEFHSYGKIYRDESVKILKNIPDFPKKYKASENEQI